MYIVKCYIDSLGFVKSFKPYNNELHFTMNNEYRSIILDYHYRNIRRDIVMSLLLKLCVL